ncbi:MAG: hypothetical protein DHS20C16_07450 [Phycisphaerae bacterium]|nr:MAG: hypothetical protein DHS20C16_07450 [Phycisphaerae bacterium]
MNIKHFTTGLVVCVLVGAFVIGCTPFQTKVWVEQTDQLSFDAAGLNKLAITTYNGPIKVKGETGRNDVHVVVTRKGGGKDEESATAALEAIEVISEASGDGTHQLGYRWNVEKQYDWQARVSFEVAMPSRLITNAKSHNGAISIGNVDGECDLVTHNGAVTATDVRAVCRIETHNGRISIGSPEATVSATTHNGAITAECGGESVNLSSHNGPIKLDATTATALNGVLTTYNGAIGVVVPTTANAKVTCKTNNGSIQCDAPWKETKKTRRFASGVLGDGTGQFKAETHNGSIRIQEAKQ